MKLDLNFDFFGELKESHQPRPSKSVTVDRWGRGWLPWSWSLSVIEIFGKKWALYLFEWECYHDFDWVTSATDILKSDPWSRKIIEIDKSVVALILLMGVEVGFDFWFFLDFCIEVRGLGLLKNVSSSHKKESPIVIIKRAPTLKSKPLTFTHTTPSFLLKITI